MDLGGGESRPIDGSELAEQILIRRQRHKIAYATDGAANAENREKLLRLVRGADVFYSETCFLERDRTQADATKHFTARFVAELARDAEVKKLVPFHFSKRYVEAPEQVWDEARDAFSGELVKLAA